MARTPEKAKGRKANGRFAGIPHAVMNHPDYIALSASAIRLLLELSYQYNGHNNGALSAVFSSLHRRGFNSKTTLAKSLRELEEKRLMIRTRESRFLNPGRRCALYALTWLAIDECPGKELDVRPTAVPPRSFTVDTIKTPGPVYGPSGTSLWTHGGGKHA